jgi:hypothetical protein
MYWVWFEGAPIQQLFDEDQAIRYAERYPECVVLLAELECIDA